MKTPELPSFEYTPKVYTGPSAEEVFALRKQFLNPALFLYYQKPMMIVEGKGQYVFDEKGRRYLDGIAGIATVSPPAVASRASPIPPASCSAFPIAELPAI